MREVFVGFNVYASSSMAETGSIHPWYTSCRASLCGIASVPASLLLLCTDNLHCILLFKQTPHQPSPRASLSHILPGGPPTDSTR